MENDNVYINDGQYFQPTIPEAVEKASNSKRDETLAQLPLLQEHLSHLNDRISATDSVKQALVVAKSYDTTTANALIALDIVRQQLEDEKRYLQGRIDQASK